MRFIITDYLIQAINKPLFIAILCLIFSPTLRALNCMNDFAQFNNPVCTANDVSTAILGLISGPSVCVSGVNIYIQLQAQTVAGANTRYDIGYYVALDGGNAKTGTCYVDNLPPPLNTTATVGPIRTSPFFDAETNGDTCGDIEQNKTDYRNLGGATVSSGTPGPPAIIAIPCQDTTIDNIADVSVCTTWDNQSNNNCHSAADAVPNTASKCNCNSLPVANIVFLATCTTNADCNDNNACTADSCDTESGNCSNIAIGAGTACNDGNLCTTNDICGGAGNVICLGSPVVCPGSDQCNTSSCDFGTGLCSVATPVANGTLCNDAMACTSPDACTNGLCLGTDTCGPGLSCQGDLCLAAPSCIIDADCNDLNPCTDNLCILGTCSTTNNADPCEDGNGCTQNDICSAGSCQSGAPIVCVALDQCHVAGICDPDIGLCSNPNQPNATPCDDGMSCTSFDACLNGTCSAISNCVFGFVCQNDQCVASPTCVNSSECDDGIACTADLCVNSHCIHPCGS